MDKDSNTLSGQEKYFIRRDVPFEFYEIALLNTSDKELLEISKITQAGLSLDEMKRVREYFTKKGRNPTDIEFQALGQAWSEHSCYKTSRPILKKHIFSIDAPQNILVIKEDAGVLEFDKDHAYVLALESHNHPSAIEPYGGSATGIGGILRDVVCMGAQPIALIDPLFFGSLNYPMKKVPTGVKHPKYLLKGVVDGIRDYGNRVGIPTTTGMVHFHNGYLGNCLVNVGCVGIVEKKYIIRSRVKTVDDIFVLIGGKTGRDGIHGVTFASADLHEKSEEEDIGAVQLGDPITKEPVIHVCLEANKMGLLNGMKDFGGGGLSSVAGELALAGGYGARIDIDRIPLKEVGLSPWEIWISESQERMMVTVSPANIAELLAFCELWDVEATVIGRVKKGKTLEAYYQDELVMDLDLEFYTGGPTYNRPYTYNPRKINEKFPKLPKTLDEKYFNKTLHSILSHENVASKSSIIRQYDHEVRGRTVLKPLHGKSGFETHGDAVLIKPLEHSDRCLALSSDVNPHFMELDPYKGALSAMDENIRNLVAVGATPHSFADCLNFGNPEVPETLGDFVEAVRGLGKVALELGIPFASGNVSLYNETQKGAIPPTPTILGVGILEDYHKTTTVDLKKEGNLIYLVGKTGFEMGGSMYYTVAKGASANVPNVEIPQLKDAIEHMTSAIRKGFVASCHDISSGGLAVALTEMCIGGDLGACVDLSAVELLAAKKLSTEQQAAVKLFSESNTRWLVEVPKRSKKNFEAELANIPFFELGKVDGSGKKAELIIFGKPGMLVKEKISKLRKSWESFSKLMI